MGFQRVCVDAFVPDHLRRKYLPTSGRMTHGRPPTEPAKKLAYDPDRCWPNGAKLKCRCLNGSKDTVKRVEEIAKTWSTFANIDFDFVDRGSAEIRIAFDRGGSWSAVGTDALVNEYFPRHAPTMNFGWLDDSLPDEEWESVVLHEFGHALGCVHEHQSPEFDRKWDRDAVVQYFSGPPNWWSLEEIEHNVLQQYSGMIASKYDPDSIMLYMFDRCLFSDSGGSTKANSKLSKNDIAHIKSAYPGR